MKNSDIKKHVREGYANIAKNSESCCSGPKTCCGSSDKEILGKSIGYTEEEMKSVPEGANLGLGCGNPTAIAEINEGETVVDLGSGAGFDCFLAAKKVGEKGLVIGVDMTAEMIDKARANAEKSDIGNVEFRLGEIENLPVADNTADVIISNCVINLAPDKFRVFKETFRILKPGGRLIISDIVLLNDIPDKIRNNINAYISCISGAVNKDNYIGNIENAGFKDIRIINEKHFSAENYISDLSTGSIPDNLNLNIDETRKLLDAVCSIIIKAEK